MGGGQDFNVDLIFLKLIVYPYVSFVDGAGEKLLLLECKHKS